jgi:hypothetical protein
VSDSPDHSAGLRTLLPRLWAHLSPTRRWQIGVSLLVMIASGLAEIVSLAALVPFLSVLADPARVWQEPRIRGVAEALGYSAPGQLLLLLIVANVILAAALPVLGALALGAQRLLPAPQQTYAYFS